MEPSRPTLRERRGLRKSAGVELDWGVACPLDFNLALKKDTGRGSGGLTWRRDGLGALDTPAALASS